MKTAAKKLFLVCPFCQMEHFINQHYGEAYFLTAPASVFHFDADYLNSVKHLIDREQISELYVVADSSCNFVHDALEGRSAYPLSCEKTLQQLKTDSDTVSSLQQKILQHQAAQLQQDSLLGKEINSGKLNLHLIATEKNENCVLAI